MHLRPPSIAHGVTSAVWAVVFGVVIFFGALIAGADRGTSFVVAVVAGFGIFLFVRLHGEDPLRRP